MGYACLLTALSKSLLTGCVFIAVLVKCFCRAVSNFTTRRFAPVASVGPRASADLKAQAQSLPATVEANIETDVEANK